MNKKGFTLVELMIVIFLGAIVFAGASITLVSMARQAINYQKYAERDGETDLYTRALTDMMRKSKYGGYGTETNQITMEYANNGTNYTLRIFTQEIGSNSWGTVINRFMYDPGDGTGEQSLGGNVVYFQPDMFQTKRPGGQLLFQTQDELTGRKQFRTLYVGARND